MFFRRQEGQYRETDRVTRYKLVKSGKHWLRASTSLFGLFKVFRGSVDTTQVMTEVVENQTSQYDYRPRYHKGTSSYRSCIRRSSGNTNYCSCQ